jgi:hypothetical protein
MKFKNTATLDTPLAIDVRALAENFPDYWYGGTIKPDKYSAGITSERVIDRANNYRLILNFDGNDGQGFTTVSSDIPLKELAYILGRLPAEQFEKLRNAFAGTPLELPILTVFDLEQIRYQEDRRVRDRQLVEEVRSIGQRENYGHFTSAEAEGILQHEMGFTDAKSERPVLATFGAGPCIAIAVYNPETRTASLAHIDALTELPSTDALFYQLSKDSDATLEVHLAGGMEMSREQVTELIRRIQIKPNVAVKSANIIPEDGGFGGKSLAIDSRTGEVFTDFDVHQLNTPNLDGRLMMVGMQFIRSPINWAYDGRVNAEVKPYKIQPTFFSSSSYDFHQRTTEQFGEPSVTRKDFFRSSQFSEHAMSSLSDTFLITDGTELTKGSQDELVERLMIALKKIEIKSKDREPLWEILKIAPK